MRDVAPVDRSKARARTTYDRRARGYERFEGRFERHARIAGERLLGVQAGERVLEIGSGPGASLVAFARASGADGYVVGVDIAPNMHREASRRLRGLGSLAHVSLIVGDAACIPIRDGWVDGAFACFTLELFDTPELPVVLGELRRVLRSGGRLAVVSLTSTTPPSLMERAYLIAHHLMPALADCRPIPLRTLLEEAGFEVVDRQRKDIFGVPVEATVAVPRSA